MKRFLLGLTAALLLSGAALAQQIAPGQIMGNDRATAGTPRGASIDAIFDQALGATANRIFCNLAGLWQSCAQPILGTNGGTAGTIAFLGSTSGTVLLTPQAAAGTPTLMFPTASGTFAVSGTAPVTLNATTGALSLATNGITNALFRQSVALSLVGRASNTTGDVADIVAGSDFQIMRRSGTAIGFGSIDLSNTGAVGSSILGLNNGGAGRALTASNGGLVYTDADSMEVLAGTATAGQIPRSGANAAPSWSTFTMPATAAQGTILSATSANVFTASTTPVLGLAGTSLGSLGLSGNTSGVVSIVPQAAAGTYNFNMPTSAGTSGQPLLSGGGGATAQTYGTLGIAAGGTSQTTAAAARGSAGLNIDQMSTTGDANVSIAATTRTQATSATFTAIRTWTLPAANAVNAGQQLVIADKFGAINGANTLTVQRAGADTINGATSFAMTAQYSNVELVSDGVSAWNYAASAGGGTGTVTNVDANAGAKTAAGTAITISGTIQFDQNYQGFGLQNCTLAASAAGSALTIALKDNTGADPSAASPCNVNFRNATGTTGSTTALQVAAATSLVISSGSTLGVPSSQGFKIWVVVFNDAGTARIGAFNAVTFTAINAATTIHPLSESALASSTAEGGAGAADSAGVFYTGTAVTSKAYRVAGYLEWGASGVTAGTWTTTNLSLVQAFGHGVRLPGDVIGSSYGFTATPLATTSGTFVTTNLSAAIVVQSASNLIRTRTSTAGIQSVAGGGAIFTTGRGGCTTTFGSINNVQDNTTAAILGSAAPAGVDKPNTTGSVTYNNCVRSNIGGNSVTGDASGAATIVVEEIQG